MTEPTTPPPASEAMREAVARDYVLIKRGLYYRSNSQGYTGVLDDAGRYTEAEAKAQVEHCDGITARLASEAPRFSEACWQETIIRTLHFDLAGANHEIERQASEIARLTGERDTAIEKARESGARVMDLVFENTRTNARAEAAEVETARLRAALEPFVREAERYEPDEGDDHDVLWGDVQLRIGHLRQARAALSSQEKTDG